MADARARHQLEDGVEHAEPGAQHRHDDHAAGDAARVGRPERRLRRCPHLARQVAGRLGGEQQADAHRHPAEQLRRRGRVAQRRQRVVDERVLDDVDRHRFTIQSGAGHGKTAPASTRRRPADRIGGPMLSRIAIARRRRPWPAAAAAFCVAQAPARRPVSLVVTNAIVVTMDAGRGCSSPGRWRSTAATSSPSIPPDAIAARLRGAGIHRRRRPGRDARPDQHAHARADGAVPRPRRRPGADGLAAEVHLSRRRRRPSRRSSCGPARGWRRSR